MSPGRNRSNDAIQSKPTSKIKSDLHIRYSMIIEAGLEIASL